MEAKLKQICGHGVKGTEKCPPIYHIDLPDKEFADLIADPVGFTKNLGIEVDRVSVNILEMAWDAKSQK